jgi:uncharacterized protein (TIGR03437 family)
MFRAWMALTAVALCGAARGQGPSYSAAGIVNASDYSPGPFAPNSVLTIFGSNLANLPLTTPPTGIGLSQQNINSGTIPLVLANINVFIDSVMVPLLYVSSTQINLLVPTNQVSGDVLLRVDRQGISGPLVTITLANSAPALFPSSDHFAAAQDFMTNYGLVTAAAPGQPGDLIVLYATGLGTTQPMPDTGEIPETAGKISAFNSLQVLLNGNAIDPRTIPYAGLTPGFAGLYQVNFFLPGNCPPNPQIQLAIGQQISATGIMLAVQ